MNLTLERCLGCIEIASMQDRSAFLSELSRKLLPYFTDEDLEFLNANVTAELQFRKWFYWNLFLLFPEKNYFQYMISLEIIS